MNKNYFYNEFNERILFEYNKEFFLKNSKNKLRVKKTCDFQTRIGKVKNDSNKAYLVPVIHNEENRIIVVVDNYKIGIIEPRITNKLFDILLYEFNNRNIVSCSFYTEKTNEYSIENKQLIEVYLKISIKNIRLSILKEKIKNFFKSFNECIKKLICR